MENFKLEYKTCLFFGNHAFRNFNHIANKLGNRALIVTGKHSAKQNGLLDDACEMLNNHGIIYSIFDGVRSNPRFEDVDNAAEIAKQMNADFILALGGGSVIDSAKMIAITACVNHSSWDFIEKKPELTHALDILVVLTLAATGSEMNQYAVFQNDAKKIKASFGSEFMLPKYSFLDPSYTLTVPANLTAYGISDLIAHCLEQFFGKGDATLSDKFALAIIKEAMQYGPLLMSNLSNYQYREKIMWAATNALNGTTGRGRISGDWGVHALEHQLSVLFDIAHGAGLSIVYPAWLKIMKNRIESKLIILGNELFASMDLDTIICEIETFFKLIGSPTCLEDVGIGPEQKSKILHQIHVSKANGIVYKLTQDEIELIINKMYDP